MAVTKVIWNRGYTTLLRSKYTSYCTVFGSGPESLRMVAFTVLDKKTNLSLKKNYLSKKYKFYISHVSHSFNIDIEQTRYSYSKTQTKWKKYWKNSIKY